MKRTFVLNISFILISVALLSWTTISVVDHSHSYIDPYGNEIVIENTTRFQATLDTNIVINNLTSKRFDSTLLKSDKPVYSFVISDIKRIKHKRNFSAYDIRVHTIPHSNDIAFTLNHTGYTHYCMTVSKVNGQSKITRVIYLYVEI